MKITLFLITQLFLIQAFATDIPHSFTPEQIQFMKKKNEEQRLKDIKLGAFSVTERSNSETVIPYAEYEEQGYFIFDDATNFNSRIIKEMFLTNLPDSIVPVVFTSNQSPEYTQSLKELWTPFLRNGSSLKVLNLEDPNYGYSFWARDAVPVPTSSIEDGIEKFRLVDAIYYYDYDADADMARAFEAELESVEYYFEGGNFIVNKDETCLVVNNERVERIPDSIFKNAYGCNRLERLEYLKGIGHADEVVKFVSDEIVLTNTPAYVGVLENLGYEVVLLPESQENCVNPKMCFETYINSVILEDLVYVPIFNKPTDEEALNIYRSLGLTPIPMDSAFLSNNGAGSLHCISMVYPKVDVRDLEKAFKAKLK